MKLRNLQNDGVVFAAIVPLTPDDQKQVKRTKEFGFDWTKFKDSELYKLTRTDSREILGLMAVHSNPFGGGYIEIDALEVCKSQVGRNKQIDGIAGCMIAWCARESFKRGYEGYIKLIAKTDLIAHYKTKYGMSQIGGMQTVYLDTNSAQKIIDEYLGNH